MKAFMLQLVLAFLALVPALLVFKSMGSGFSGFAVGTVVASGIYYLFEMLWRELSESEEVN
jgi:uncharacterized membrane protein